MQEVIALQQLISEFRERQTVTSLTVQTLLYRIFRHHVVHSDMLTYFTGKVKESEVLHPVIVIHQFCTVRSIGFEIQKLAQLLLHTIQIALQDFFCEQITLCRFTGRVTNHTRSTTDQCHRLVSATLEMTQYHYTAKMSNVQ